jgi:mono/diheme cytochrome c family protein
MLRRWMFVALILAAGALGAVNAQPVDNPSRGQLLYSTHCVACHTTQVHWRAKKQVTDWAGLVAMVRRWQGVEGLGWSEGDITDVARYLNMIYYRYATPD